MTDTRRVRHVKRGTTYEVVGVAEAQISTNGGQRWLVEGDRLVVYRGGDGRLWCRFPSEFHDGRFEDLDPAPPDGGA